MKSELDTVVKAMSEDLLPCPFCGTSGESRFDEQTYWTGQRAAILSVEFRHWCAPSPNDAFVRVGVTIRARTSEQAAAEWNRRAESALVDIMAEREP